MINIDCIIKGQIYDIIALELIFIAKSLLAQSIRTIMIDYALKAVSFITFALATYWLLLVIYSVVDKRIIRVVTLCDVLARKPMIIGEKKIQTVSYSYRYYVISAVCAYIYHYV